jgi:hypothetical protein
VVRACDWVDFRVKDVSTIILPQHRAFSDFIYLAVAHYCFFFGCCKGSENNRALSIVGDVLGNDRDIGDGTMADLLD